MNRPVWSLFCIVVALAFGVGFSGCSDGESTDRPDGPVDYEAAKQIVIDRLEPDWETGTFCLDDRKIVENDGVYVFDVGAREYIVDNDSDFAYAGGVPVVHKKTGRFEQRPSSEVALDDTFDVRDNPNPSDPLCG